MEHFYDQKVNTKGYLWHAVLENVILSSYIPENSPNKGKKTRHFRERRRKGKPGGVSGKVNGQLRTGETETFLKCINMQ